MPDTTPVETNGTTPVQWPAEAINANGDDLQVPLNALLVDLKLDGAQTFGDDVVGVIDSTTLARTKQVQNALKAIGGLTVFVGAATSAWAAVRDNTPLAVAIAAGIAVVLAAMTVGLAMVMNADIRSRAAVTVEQLRSRASVAEAFLTEAADLSHASTKPSLADDLRVALAAYGD
jgi:hypothetical protein